MYKFLELTKETQIRARTDLKKGPFYLVSRDYESKEDVNDLRLPSKANSRTLTASNMEVSITHSQEFHKASAFIPVHHF